MDAVQSGLPDYQIRSDWQQALPASASAPALILLEESMLTEAAGLIMALRGTLAPGPPPVLLLLHAKHGAALSEDENDFVDDLIYLPLDEVELGMRVRNLLRLRACALEKAALAEELAATRERQTVLRRSENKFRGIFEHSLAVMLLVDPETRRIISANRAAVDFYGWSAVALQAMRVEDLDTLPVEQARKAVKKVSRSKRSCLQLQHRIASGALRDVEVYTNRIHIDEKEFIFSIVHDITQRKSAERERAHSVELLRHIIDHNKNASAIFDRELRHIYVSQRYLHDYAVEDTDIIGKQHYEVFPEIPPRWREVHRRALAGEVLRMDEDFFEHPDGSVDWVSWECRPWYASDGSIGGMILYSERINERKEREQTIRRLNERLKILVQAIQQLAAANSLEAVQQNLVSAVRSMLGCDAATLVLREGDQVYYLDEDAIEPLWKGRRFGMDACISGWVITENQAAVIEDIYTDARIPQDIYSPTFVRSLAMVPIHTIEPLGALGAYWQKPHRASDEEVGLLDALSYAAARAIETIQLTQQLEQRVAQRTSELEAVNRELETFTYSVSHDLKAPLRGIDGYSKLLFDQYGGQLDDEARFFISSIRDATQQMNSLISDLLAYSRMERASLHLERIAVPGLIEAIASSYQRELEQKSIRLHRKIDLEEMVADSTALTVSLRNLLDNAIKFSSGTAAPEIILSAEAMEDAWLLCVADNGPGFDMKYHDRIFEIFQRLHRSEDYPGTGVGLAIVAKAVKRMGGQIYAQSAPGKGAAFTIKIPKITL